MRATEFREELVRRLDANQTRTVLRIITSPFDTVPVELTGRDVIDKSLSLADRYVNAPGRSVVLLLIPHSVELFLLYIGTILRGRLPAILSWPTNRVDPEKYQRNLLHQLRNLPASQLITVPSLVPNLDTGLPYLVSPCPIGGIEYLEKG